MHNGSVPGASSNGLYLSSSASPRPILLTGGAGFVGTNLAHRLLSQGQSVLILDNLSRAGVEQNLRWLQQTHGKLVRAEVGDLRDAALVKRVVQNASAVYHFAAQVAVTTSLCAPLEDFETKARGTLNLLEALRNLDNTVPLVFTSTNKVYGGLEDVVLRLENSRYEPEDADGASSWRFGSASPRFS
jgi:CDP-paratose 2-epimerase